MKICNVPTKTHILKLREEFCDDVFAGYKNFEVRENDRGYQRGDIVQFKSVNKLDLGLNHPINDKVYEITYVLSGRGIKENYVVFGIREIRQNSFLEAAGLQNEKIRIEPKEV